MPRLSIILIAALLGAGQAAALPTPSPTQGRAMRERAGIETAGFKVARELDLRYPHHLGSAVARKRVYAKLDSLKRKFAGSLSASTIVWNGDQAQIRVTALGQVATAQVLVQPADVLIHAQLPVLLSPLAGNIEAFLDKTAAETLH